MKHYLLAMLTFNILFAGCTNKANFTVINQSNESVDSVLVQPDKSASKRYFKLAPGESQKVSIDISDFGDGAYGIVYKMKSIKKSVPFGYFSNGNVLESEHNVYIKSDTVLYKSK